MWTSLCKCSMFNCLPWNSRSNSSFIGCYYNYRRYFLMLNWETYLYVTAGRSLGTTVACCSMSSLLVTSEGNKPGVVRCVVENTAHCTDAFLLQLRPSLMKHSFNYLKSSPWCISVWLHYSRNRKRICSNGICTELLHSDDIWLLGLDRFLCVCVRLCIWHTFHFSTFNYIQFCSFCSWFLLIH